GTTGSGQDTYNELRVAVRALIESKTGNGARPRASPSGARAYEGQCAHQRRCLAAIPAKLVSVRYHVPREEWTMPNVLVRDLDDDVLKRLKAAARANGRSLQAEIHDALKRATTRHVAETRRLSTRWLNRLRRSPHSDSAALIREDRDA